MGTPIEVWLRSVGSRLLRFLQKNNDKSMGIHTPTDYRRSVVQVSNTTTIKPD